MRRVFTFLLLLAVFAAAEPPAGYYNSAESLSGPALKESLRQIIDQHTVIAYADLIAPLRAIWQDPQDSSKITLIYGSTPVAKTATSWNREHLWPRSRGVNPGSAQDGGPDDSDLFHVVPADGNVNSARSNLYFDLSRPEDGGFKDPAHIEAPVCTRDANSWQPPPGERGDIARALFYMATRYDGSEPGTADLELLTSAPGDARMANLATLLAWHAEDPPDAAERARNDLIFASYQHNRNPFIDRPEWVGAIWGTLTGGATAQISASHPRAYETPGAPVTFTVALNAPAPAGGVTISYTLSGPAVAGQDYALSGASLDPVAQTITIPEGATSSDFTLTAIANEVKETEKALAIALAPKAGYDMIGGPATVAILDEQIVAREVLAHWNFDAIPLPSPIPADVGIASVNTATWTGAIDSFGGVSGQSLALIGSAGNDSFIEIVFSTAGWANLRVQFSTRANMNGTFTSGTWSWSADGAQFTAIEGINTVATGTVFQARTLDLSAIPGVQNQSTVTLRYRLSGTTNSSANNRIDDLAITGHRYSPGWLARFPALAGEAASPSADPDGDTFDNFREWALDRNPVGSSSLAPALIGAVLEPDRADNDIVKLWPAITFVRRVDTLRLQIFPEESTDLLTWSGGCVLLSIAPGASPDSETVTYRSTVPAGASPVFFRLRIREE